MISTTRKFPKKSAAAAREAPFARVLSGKISGGYIQTVAIQPVLDCQKPVVKGRRVLTPCEACFKSEDKKDSCDTRGWSVDGDTDCLTDQHKTHRQSI